MQPSSSLQFDRQPDQATLRALHSLYTDFRDPLQFVPASLMVQKRQGQLVPFNLKRAQKRLVERVKARRAAGRPVRMILDKTRRVGISAVIAAIIFEETPFFEGQSALILAHEKRAARNLFNYYNRFEQNFKPFKGIGLPMIRNRIESQDSGALVWVNRSRIDIATAKNLDFSRSFDFRFLHLSEIAYYPNIRGLMTALIATVADDPGTMVFKESTANGYNDFHKDCILAMEGESDYEFFFAGCFEDEENRREFEPDVDKVKFEESLTDHEWSLIEAHDLVLEQIYWWRKKLQEFSNDLKRMQQEYPATWQESFQSSGNQRFDPSLFAWMPTKTPYERGQLAPAMENRKEVIRFSPHQYGELTIWKRFQPGGQYIGGVDSAKGVDVNQSIGSSENKGTPDPDYCAAVIGERALGEQVMELHVRLEPTPYAQYLYDLGAWCFELTGDWVYWVIEVEFNGGNGLAVCRELQRLGYPMDRIYFSQKMNTAAPEPTYEIGFVIRPNTRPLLISNFEMYVIKRAVTLKSPKLISEALTFVKKSKGGTVKIEHEQSCHDDILFAGMYMCWGFEYAPVFQVPKRVGSLLPATYGQQGLTEAQKQRIKQEARIRNSMR